MPIYYTFTFNWTDHTGLGLSLVVFSLGLITPFWSWSWSCTLWSRSWPWSHYVLVSLTSLALAFKQLCSKVGKVSAGLAESNGILLLGLLLISPSGWLPGDWDWLQAVCLTCQYENLYLYWWRWWQQKKIKNFTRGLIFEKSYDELTKNLWNSLTYEKLRMSMWLSKNLTIILRKTLDEVMQNLRKTYDDITGILRKHKICGKSCHSGNPLSEAVIGGILWAKNNWQPEWWFPKNAFEKWLTV